MTTYCNRWLQPLLQRKTKDHPVVVVTGARQVGKTTLLKEEFPTWNYLTLDDFDLMAQLKKDPEFILSNKQPLILDEIQRLPELFLVIKKIVDEHPSSRFILSGSANLLLMNHVSESLAGRAVFLDLGPLTQGEILKLPPSNFLQNLLDGKKSSLICSYESCKDLSHKVWRGGMPRIYNQKNAEVIIEWFEGYLRTYLEKDLKQLSQIDYLADFRQLMIASALRCGNILNLSQFGCDVGLKQPTAHRYMNLLEISGLVFRLPAYAVNRGKRLIKRPKIMWLDSGLASFLSGHYSANDLKSSREWGGILECFAFHHLKQLASLLVPNPLIHYWRTSAGQEVDFVIEQGKKLTAIEIKSATKVRYGDTLPMQTFLKDYPQAKIGVILHSGEQVEEIVKGIFALPLSALWSRNP